MGLIIRALLVVGGWLASWFFAEDALNFPVMAFLVSMFVLVGLIVLLGFWQPVWQWFKKLFNKGRSNPSE